MPIGIERGLDRSVTEPLLDNLRMLTLSDQERNAATATEVLPRVRYGCVRDCRI
jgi:hypothetical protein